MGRFVYGEGVRMEFDDRALAHLQVVITNKLRRNEPFPFTWANDASIGGGRTSVWVHASAHMVFAFHGSRSPKLNRKWLEALMYTANSSTGLYVVPEPPDLPGDDGEG